MAHTGHIRHQAPQSGTTIDRKWHNPLSQKRSRRKLLLTARDTNAAGLRAPRDGQTTDKRRTNYGQERIPRRALSPRF